VISAAETTTIPLNGEAWGVFMDIPDRGISPKGGFQQARNLSSIALKV
jgi:hypothetical protein